MGSRAALARAASRCGVAATSSERAPGTVRVGVVTAVVVTVFGELSSSFRTSSQTTNPIAIASARTAPIRIGVSRRGEAAWPESRTTSGYFLRRLSSSPAVARDELDPQPLEVLDAAVRDVHDVGDARALEQRDGDGAAVSGRAGDRERLRAPPHLRRGAVAEVVPGHVQRALDVPLLPLVVLAHVEQHDLLAPEPLREALRVEHRRRDHLEAHA